MAAATACPSNLVALAECGPCWPPPACRLRIHFRDGIDNPRPDSPRWVGRIHGDRPASWWPRPLSRHHHQGRTTQGLPIGSAVIAAVALFSVVNRDDRLRHFKLPEPAPRASATRDTDNVADTKTFSDCSSAARYVLVLGSGHRPGSRHRRPGLSSCRKYGPIAAGKIIRAFEKKPDYGPASTRDTAASLRELAARRLLAGGPGRYRLR